METLAARLDRVMKLQGWKAATLARAADLGTNTIQKILERGAGAHSTTVGKISRVTGASIEWLLQGTGHRLPLCPLAGDLPPRTSPMTPRPQVDLRS